MMQNDTSGSTAVTLSKDAKWLVDAYFLAYERLDIQYNLDQYPTFVGEEVVIVSSDFDYQPRYILLKERERNLQADMKSVGADGTNLVILSRSRMNYIYKEIFAIAYNAIRALKIEIEFLRQLASTEDASVHAVELACKDFLATGKSKQEFDRQLNKFLESLEQAESDQLRCVLVLIQFILFTQENAYQPAVDLGSTDSFANNATHQILIKYTSRRSYQYRKRDGIIGNIFGYWVITSPVPYSDTSSSHFRIRSPTGLTFSRPLKTPKIAKDEEADGHQIQLYIPPKEYDAGWQESEETKENGQDNLFQVRLNQTMGTRLLLFASYGIVAWLPFMIALAKGGAFSISGIELTTRFLLPIILALVAASWNLAHVRTFAVTQLVVILMLLSGWLFVLLDPLWKFPLMVSGSILMLYNLVEFIIKATGFAKD